MVTLVVTVGRYGLVGFRRFAASQLDLVLFAQRLNSSVQDLDPELAASKAVIDGLQRRLVKIAHVQVDLVLRVRLNAILDEEAFLGNRAVGCREFDIFARRSFDPGLVVEADEVALEYLSHSRSPRAIVLVYEHNVCAFVKDHTLRVDPEGVPRGLVTRRSGDHDKYLSIRRGLELEASALVTLLWQDHHEIVGPNELARPQSVPIVPGAHDSFGGIGVVDHSDHSVPQSCPEGRGVLEALRILGVSLVQALASLVESGRI